MMTVRPAFGFITSEASFPQKNSLQFFSNSEELEQDIDELLTLGQRTPFLLLEHPFARRVLAAIRAMVPASGHLAAGTTFFRAGDFRDFLRSENMKPS